jgi:hypothetical protein
MVIEFIEHFQIVTTSNCSAISISHTMQFTTARFKSSQSAVFTSRYRVTDINNALSFPAHVLTG